MAGQFVITPWVGILPPNYVFTANPYEVADIFTVRLSELADPKYHAQSTRSWNGNTYEISIINAGRHEIWGATHQITTPNVAVVAGVSTCAVARTAAPLGASARWSATVCHPAGEKGEDT